jgi:hypothetical protein
LPRLVLAGLCWTLLPAALPAQSPICLRDVTAAAGAAFRHTDGGAGRFYIVETVASGMATFDYDQDGWIDLYFLNGRPLRGTPAGAAPRNALYRNLADSASPKSPVRRACPAPAMGWAWP